MIRTQKVRVGGGDMDGQNLTQGFRIACNTTAGLIEKCIKPIRRIRMLKTPVKKMRRDERGITGLETAIILIAFVVVASVFAYTVLSAGIFSSQKAQEAVYTGLQTARSTMELRGDVVAESNGTAITSLVLCVANALNGQSIDLTPPGNSTTHPGLASPGSSNVVVVSFSDSTQRIDDLYWTAEELGNSTAGGHILGPGQTFQMTIDLEAVAGHGIGTYDTFEIDIKPPVGSVLTIEKTTPAQLEPYMVLN
jgi:flagellin FlaB